MYPNHKRKGTFNRDSTAKSSCWHQVLSLWPSNPDLFQFVDQPSLQDLTIFMAPHSRAPFKWPVLCSSCTASCTEHSPNFPRACTRVCVFVCYNGWMTDTAGWNIALNLSKSWGGPSGVCLPASHKAKLSNHEVSVSSAFGFFRETIYVFFDRF